ncbi:MAG: tRNA (adenosine(37)-N6)-threonylcarbamoyltransferase complex dimerization subunit type 1 TsaB [Candidatus Eremiobacteraeota bacterium]|nr:tRNA (adenosine(37)-N6)-threonylcarbamoyltransferase complex dimerization subunit type 1 TsaB [Candidatus Eremiobacteraeota bacterium]
MKDPILALDGALGEFSLAVSVGGAERHLARGLDGAAALEGGLAAIEAILAQAGIGLRELGGLAVGTGPGRFTGLRIAISFAKALAVGAGLPLAGVSSFDVVEEGAAPNAGARVPRLTIVEGRPGIISARRVDRAGSTFRSGRVREVLDALAAPETAITVVGATEDVRAALGERGASVSFVSGRPELAAVALLRIARRRPPAELHALRPDYGEAPAVRIRP